MVVNSARSISGSGKGRRRKPRIKENRHSLSYKEQLKASYSNADDDAAQTDFHGARANVVPAIRKRTGDHHQARAGGDRVKDTKGCWQRYISSLLRNHLIDEVTEQLFLGVHRIPRRGHRRCNGFDSGLKSANLIVLATKFIAKSSDLASLSYTRSNGGATIGDGTNDAAFKWC